jgi:circadian clock protein KaiC
MLGGLGFYRGSSVLISGTAGSGKTSLAATFADAAAARHERCLYFAFEESQSQVIRNMRSIGLDLEKHVRAGTLRFHAARPTAFGLEMHLVLMHRAVEEFKPDMVVMDPLTNLITAGMLSEVHSVLMRLIDFLKLRGITALFTSLTSDGDHLEPTDVGVSALIDTWLLVRDIEINGERNRALYLLKSRGMAHSNQLREFRLTDHGIELIDVYLGPSGGLVTGSARAVHEAEGRAVELRRHQDIERRQRAVERKRMALEAQIAALRAEIEADAEESQRLVDEETSRQQAQARDDDSLARLRWVDRDSLTRKPGGAPGTAGKRTRKRRDDNQAYD